MISGREARIFDQLLSSSSFLALTLFFPVLYYMHYYFMLPVLFNEKE